MTTRWGSPPGEERDWKTSCRVGRGANASVGASVQHNADAGLPVTGAVLSSNEVSEELDIFVHFREGQGSNRSVFELATKREAE